MKRFLSCFFIFLFFYFFISSFAPPVYAVGECQTCSQSNCCGAACSSSQRCDGDTTYGCDCVNNTGGATNTPVPTSGGNPEPTLPGGASPTGQAPLPTTIPNTTISPFEEACGTGKCTNGYYCCQQANGDPACCIVGDVEPTNDPNPPGGGITCNSWTQIYVNNCSEAEFLSEAADCYTSGVAVTLHLAEADAFWMGFANVTTTTNCDSVSNATYNANRSFYSATKSWNLTAGSGDKKVCVSFSNLLSTQVAKCGAQIILGTAPTATPTPTPTATPTPTPSSWLKLKNTSFISVNALNSDIPLFPVAYDATGDDDGTANFIVDNTGVVGAPTVNITGVNASAKTGSPEYKVTGYSPANLMAPGSFLAYIKARKQHLVITNSDLSEITASGIYIYQNAGSLVIDSANSSVFNNKNIVLMSQGVVNIDDDFNPTGSVAIVADQIIFGNTVTQAQGVFIANTISSGTADFGLKIIGNLIAQISFFNNRTQANPNRPAIFVVYDPVQYNNFYVDLLPYLSTANYDWRQIQ